MDWQGIMGWQRERSGNRGEVMAKKYRVQLTPEEQEELKGWCPAGGRQHISRLMPASCYSATRTRTAGPMNDKEIAGPEGGYGHRGTGAPRCVERVWRVLGTQGAVEPSPEKLDGEGEAHLIALACSQPPEGRVSWTLQMLADRLVEREIVDSISTGTVPGL